MRAVAKTVYYCDFCRRYRLARNAMEMHERHCTANPERVCRWDWDHRSNEPHPVERSVPDCVQLLLAAAEVTKADIEWLRADLNGCPACMLTAIRCSGHDKDLSLPFNYRDEVARHEQDRRSDEEERERAYFEGSWA